MNRWKLAVAVVWLVLMSPIILINVWGFKASMWTASFMSAEESGDTGKSLDLLSRMPVFSPFGSSTNREVREMRAAFSPDTLNDERRVRIDTTVEMTDLLGPDEAEPDPAFAVVYAKARAPQFLIGYCDEVNATIGSKCGVGKAQASVGKKGVRISGWLTYVPNYDIGAPEASESYDLLSSTLQLLEGVDKDDLPLDTSENQQTYLEMSKGYCTKLKKIYGNCVVSSVSFTSFQPWYNKKTQVPVTRLRARASFKVYSPFNPDGAALLAKTLEDLS